MSEPQPPQMSASPDNVLAWGEHLLAAWRANPNDDQAWQAWQSYLAGWCPGLLKLARQGLEANGA